MNRLARHELAERTFVQRHVRPPERWIRSSTTGPFDLVLFRPRAGTLRSTFVEIKTAQGRRSSDLSEAEQEFGRFAESNGSPYVVARYRVVNDRAVSEHIYRPFAPADARAPEAEIVLEVTR